MKKVYTSLDLLDNELLNFRIENTTLEATSNAATTTPKKSAGYFYEKNNGSIAYFNDNYLHYKDNAGIKTIATQEWANNAGIKLSSSYKKATTGSTDFTAGFTTLETAIASLAKAVDGKTSNTGTVTSVGMSVPAGFAVTPKNDITTSGTFAISFETGYSLPSTADQSAWNNTAATVSAGIKDWNSAYAWVSANGDDAVLGLKVGFPDENPDQAIETSKLVYSLSASNNVAGFTIHKDNLCIVTKNGKYYKEWDSGFNSHCNKSSLERKGMCVVCGKNIYQYSGSWWVLKYSGADASLEGRVADLEAYFDNKADTDNALNKWHEIVAFLSGFGENDNLITKISTLESAISGKMADAANTGSEGDVLAITRNSTDSSKLESRWVKKKIVAISSDDYGDTLVDANGVWTVNISALGTLDVNVTLYRYYNGGWQECFADILVKSASSGVNNAIVTFGKGRSTNDEFKLVVTA